MAGALAHHFGMFQRHKRDAVKTGRTMQVQERSIHGKKNEKSMHLNTSDTLSDEDNQGWRFLKSKTTKQVTQREKENQPIEFSTGEEENTADLLLVYDEPKGQAERSNSSVTAPSRTKTTEKQQNEHQMRTTPGSLSTTIIVDSKRRKSSSSIREIRTNSASKSSVVPSLDSPLDNLLMIKDDGRGGLGELSMVSFIDDESVRDQSATEFPEEDPSEFKSKLSSSHLLLSVDELDGGVNWNKSPKSGRKGDYNRNKPGILNDQLSTASEVDECLDVEPECVSVEQISSVPNQTSPSSVSDATSISEANELGVSPVPGSSFSPSAPLVVEEHDECDNYSDDFDSEPETIPTFASQTSNSTLSESKHSRKAFQSGRNTDKKQNHHRIRSSAGIKSHRSSKLEKLVQSVEVQTALTGDLITTWTSQVPPGDSTWLPSANGHIELNQTTPLQRKPIANTVVDDAVLRSLIEHNPCVVALDNMLKQQVNITRDFLAAQRQLHQAIGTALNRCLTTDYVTWENTAKILHSGDSS